MNRMRNILAATALFLAAPLASAVPLAVGAQGNVNDTNGGTVFSGGPGYQNVTISLAGGAGSTVSAGVFVLSFDDTSTPSGDWEQFLAFCIDPDRLLLNFVNPYTVNTLAGAGLSSQVQSNLAELWALARAQVTSAATSAAFQIAIWELAFGTTNYNLSSGAFVATGTASALAIAQGWLNTIRDGSGALAHNLVLLVDRNNSRQRLLTDVSVSVPEPGTLGLLGLGLVGIALRSRRRG